MFGGVLADPDQALAGGRMVLSAAMLLHLRAAHVPGRSRRPAKSDGLRGADGRSASRAMYVYYSTTYSTIQDLVEPSLRGTAMAAYFCAMYLLGASLGPIVLGKMSDHFTLAAANAAGVTATTLQALEPFKGAGLHQAMYVVPVLNLALTFCMLLAARTVPRDIAKLQDWMRSNSTSAMTDKQAA